MYWIAFSRWYVGAALVICAGAIGYAAWFFMQPAYSEAATIGEGVRTFKELEDRFKVLTQEKGGAYAFEVLRRAPLPPNTDLHLLGHVVGNELYKQEGVAGMAVCTPDFRNACSHTMVIGALAEFGESALPMIRDACRKAPGGPGAYTMCYHGLGHGIFAYYGYEIPLTVALCEKTGTPEYQNREAVECMGGMVMELAGGGGHDPELWEESREKYLTGRLMPCMSALIPDAAKEQCLAYLTPEIWKAVGIDLGHPDEELFDDAFALCDVIPKTKQSLRDACYGGFGKEFVPLAAGRDVRRLDQVPERVYRTSIAWCLYAAAKDGQAACIREGLSSIFWGGENDPEASFRYCALVPTEQHDMCMEHLALNIAQYISNPTQRESLCARMPTDRTHSLCLRGL